MKVRPGLFVLGAGFSVPARLPAGVDLWREVRKRATSLSNDPEYRFSKFRDDLAAYIDFRARCDAKKLDADDVNLEEFMGFLDLEHHLGLRGSDTWSRDGNETQIMLKVLIGQILTECTPSSNRIPALYLDFARRLRPNDLILTFNYDILLERALDEVGVKYRLHPHRGMRADRHSPGALPDNDVIIVKLHGSVDWFDRRGHLELTEQSQQYGQVPSHPIFNRRGVPYELSRLIENDAEDELGEVYRVRPIERYYASPPWFEVTPHLIAPSTNKAVYASRMSPFWYGLSGRSYRYAMGIIGYSLPPHDAYARQAIFSLVDNYQHRLDDSLDQYAGGPPSPLVIVDKRSNKDETALREAYRFVDNANAIWKLDGFDEAALDILFSGR